jgi:nucleotide-binding universal stress UspA family protein
MKILIGYDGSECATDALANLRMAGLPTGEGQVEAVVLAVANVWLPPAVTLEPAVKVTPRAVERAREEAERKLREAQTTAQEGAARLSELFPSWQIRAEAVADSPCWAIIKRAGEWPADLIVVGSHGYSGLNRLTLGSVSQKVVIESPCSVRISRQHQPPAGQPLRIIAGLDGSEDSERAVTTILNRKWPAGTEVRLVTAIDEKVITAIFDPSPLLQRWMEADDEDPLAWVSRMIGDYRARLEAAGLVVDSMVNHGDPKTTLLNESSDWNADVIFVGARGHNIIERVLIGSVSTSIISRAQCSVEVIR